MNSRKMIATDDLEKIVCQSNNRTVLTNGCFDILHLGHIRYLQKAKTLGDLLIVAINTDDSVKRLKGEKRPILPWIERAEVVAALECVDYVLPIIATDAAYIVKALRPTIYVKGGDYQNIENTEEAKAAREVGSIVCTVPSDIDRSTSDIVQRILLNYMNG